MNDFIYDKIFLMTEGQTLPDDLAALVVAATNAASDLKIVNVPSFRDVHRDLQGDLYTAATPPKNYDDLFCATVGAAWFTDNLNRKHVRVIGAAIKLKAWLTNRLWPANIQPPQLVYPGLNCDRRGFYLRCKCSREIACTDPAWNGRQCEVCEDRAKSLVENGYEPYFPAQKKRQP